jgi:hypothetical protein
MISGETLQSIAEIGLYSEMTDLIANQIRTKPQNLLSISEVSTEDIKKCKRIYVYTQFIDSFFDKFFPYLQDVVLITHNSDYGIHDKHLKYLEGNNILKWYCQNRETSHPKLVSIPIGLANSQWPHGNQELIAAVKAEKNRKEILVYKNFDVSTNYGERSICNAITNNSGIHMSDKTTVENYWRNISKSLFVISPPGNGIDCHRIWEALFLGTTPVVKYHESFSQFKHLPILFVDSWETVTLEFLRNKVDVYKNTNYDIPELYIEFWKSRICLE